MGGRTRRGRSLGRRIWLMLALVLSLAATLGWPGGPMGRVHAAPPPVGDCTDSTGLFAAVGAAAPEDTITFSCSGTIVLSSTLNLTKNLTIDGGVQSAAISGGGTVLVLSVNGGVTASLNHITITNGNPAHGVGGGIVNNGTLTISNSTISNNHAASAPGIANFGTLTVSNSTIGGNGAAGGGGGIDNGGSASIGNTIIAGNSSGGDYGLTAPINLGGNLDSDGSCRFGTTIPFANLLLGSLANNGGPTQTMALLPGSPAIGIGVSAICNAAPVNGLDQRGFPRPSTTCDSGAYEATPAPLVHSSPPPPVLLSCSNPPPITFAAGSALLGSAPLVNGTATLTTGLPAGTLSLNASYAPTLGSMGMANYLPSSATISLAVGQAATTVNLSSLHPTGTIGQEQRFTAQVQSAGPVGPTGTINFYDTSTSPQTLLGTATLDT